MPFSSKLQKEICLHYESHEISIFALILSAKHKLDQIFVESPYSKRNYLNQLYQLYIDNKYSNHNTSHNTSGVQCF